MQLTIFADGEPRVKPLLIFRGTGKRIPFKEQVQYDKRVTVRFQPKAWCDQEVMEYWVKNCWKPRVRKESLLVLDVHTAQKTERIKTELKECNTTPVFVPAGCTPIVQPLDVSYNAPFKTKVETAATNHLHDNVEGYLHGRFTAGERRVLISKWVGEAWEELSQNKEVAVRSFKKCGISVAADGSEDFEIHLEGLEDYEVDQVDDPDIDGDPFADLSDDARSLTEDGSNGGDPYADLSDNDSFTEEI